MVFNDILTSLITYFSDLYCLNLQT